MTPPSFPMGLYSSDWTTQLQGMEKEESSNNSNNMNMTTSSSNTEEAVKCPRCSSSNTKFCYYNNYSLSQPRHFCKACKRYWTRGGTLRNVPVGGACRKSKPRSKKSLTGMMTTTASHHRQLLNSHHMSSSFSQLTSRIGRLTSETLQALLFGNGNGNRNDDTHTNTNALLGFSGLEEGYGFMGGSATSDSRCCLGYEQQLLNDYQPWSVRTYQNESPTETETETETLNVLGSLQALNAASSSCEAVFNDEWRKTETELDPCWNETECGYGDVLYPNKQDIYVSH